MTRKPLPEIPHVEPEPGEQSFTCRHCKKLWPNKHEFTGGGGLCRNCSRAEGRKNAGSTSKFRSRHLKKSYGLTDFAFHDLLKAQDHKCPTCLRKIEYNSSSLSGSVPGRAVVDHDHRTGKVRGLLCGRCNLGFGGFDDNPDNLQRAIEYLRNPPAASPPKPRFWSVKPQATQHNRFCQGTNETPPGVPDSGAGPTVEELQKSANDGRAARRRTREYLKTLKKEP